ncbi:TerC family protein [Paenibacillus sp. YYML68]|uniref:TerC family protein n=1 Tax=Paenibacillus sp. YYML68 TaxID=2909250 RepID=UPI0024918220|nr:TerC family protein [Paenibacillus sp. YYML68]
MLINLVLSGDNAVVIAMASKNLPLAQRKQAIWWGAFGAVALRVVLTLIAVYILDIPYIQALGSLLLLWIAVKLLIEEEGHANIREASTLGKAVSTIIVADFIMSLDNVLAIAAKAKGETGIIILGIGLSIPIIIWGSNMVVKLLKRFPVLIYIGAAILGFTAGEMFIADQEVTRLLIGDSKHYMVPLCTTMFVLACGLVKQLAVRPKQTPQ